MEEERLNKTDSEELRCPEWDGNLRHAPCTRDCPYRHPGCHAKSKEYAKYRAAKDEQVTQRNAIRAGRYSVNDRLRVNHKLIDKSKRKEF